MIFLYFGLLVCINGCCNQDHNQTGNDRAQVLMYSYKRCFALRVSVGKLDLVQAPGCEAGRLKLANFFCDTFLSSLLKMISEHHLEQRRRDQLIPSHMLKDRQFNIRIQTERMHVKLQTRR
jgi:hypothetical protein